MATKHIPFFVSAYDAPAKQKILIAALELFTRDGLCETSIRDIAKLSGFTNPALFKHFSGKDALADYLFERCYVELFHMVHQASTSSTKFGVRQRAVIEAYMTALERHQAAVLYVQENLRYFWPRMPLEVRKRSILGEVKLLLEDGQRQGLVTQEIDSALLATAWIGTLQQFTRAQYFGDFKQPRKKIQQSLEELLMRMGRV